MEERSWGWEMGVAALRMARAQAAMMEGERSRVVEWRRVRSAASWVGWRLALKMWEKAREMSVGGMEACEDEQRRLRRGVIEMGNGGGEAMLDAMADGMQIVGFVVPR